MSTMNMLMDLQRSYDNLNECSKILKDGSYIYLLKKLKQEFNLKKEKYMEKEKNLQTIKKEYENKCIEVMKIKKLNEELEQRLYNDSGSNLKMIDSLEKQIENNKQLVRVIENDSIDLIEKEEKFSDEKEVIRLELISLKENFESYKDVSSKKIGKAKEDMEKARNSIEALRKLIPQELLIKFDDINTRRSSAVAKLQGGVCTGCNVKVSAVTADNISKGKKIVYCDNCGRILCYNDMVDLKAVR